MGANECLCAHSRWKRGALKMETVFKDWSASISVSSNSEIVRVIFYISIFFYLSCSLSPPCLIFFSRAKEVFRSRMPRWGLSNATAS